MVKYGVMVRSSRQTISHYTLHQWFSNSQQSPVPDSLYRRLVKLVLPSIFDASLSSFMMWMKLAELSNNSVEWKNVTFLGVTTYSDLPYIFRGSGPPSANSPSIYAPGMVWFCPYLVGDGKLGCMWWTLPEHVWRVKTKADAITLYDISRDVTAQSLPASSHWMARLSISQSINQVFISGWKPVSELNAYIGLYER